MGIAAGKAANSYVRLRRLLSLVLGSSLALGFSVSVVNDVYDVLVKKVSTTVDAQNKRHQKYKKVRSTSKLLSGHNKEW